MSGPLLTARDVADRLGVSAETVLRWTRRGELPGFRLPGGALRYRDDALDGWLAERGTAPRRGSVTHPAERRPSTRSYRSTLGLVTHPEDEENL